MMIATKIEDLYFNALHNTLLEYKDKLLENKNQCFRPLYKKIAFLGVKWILSREEPKYITLQEATERQEWYEILINIMSLITPKDFEETFPIDKNYIGSKYGAKDYFTTKEFLKSLEQDKPIGDKINDLLWEYQNDYIFEFVIKYIENVSAIRRLQGQPSLAEKFVEDAGLTKYYLHKDQKGKEFIVDEQGRSYKVKKKYPFKVIKGRE